jgi:hypothetical protein
MSWRDLQAAWNRFFFEPKSPKPMAIFRLEIGLLVLCNQLLIAPDLYTWYGEKGVLARQTAKMLSGGGGLNLFDYLPASDSSVLALFLLSVLAAITLAAGFFTRTSALLVFLTLTTFNHRDTLIINSGDSILRLAAFFLTFSRAGDVYSLDRKLALRQGKKRDPFKPSAPWVMRLLQVQLCLIYLYTFCWKAMGSMWLDGTALYYTSRLQEFWRFHTPYIFEHLWTIKLWTWGTLVVEFALGTLLWIKELRYPILLAGVLLHLGIDYSMNIPLFGQIMMSAYILFVDPADIDRAINWARSKLGKAEQSPVKPAASSTRRPAQVSAS